jgi:hypothetical protein
LFLRNREYELSVWGVIFNMEILISIFCQRFLA